MVTSLVAVFCSSTNSVSVLDWLLFTSAINAFNCVMVETVVLVNALRYWLRIATSLETSLNPINSTNKSTSLIALLATRVVRLVNANGFTIDSIDAVWIFENLTPSFTTDQLRLSVVFLSTGNTVIKVRVESAF
ncbi:hypothetical protein VTH8203_03365 [Vibrio thalassae]|uniref:Uncharacterized protein n=1 Tax=Vibrio thalassae TaxID=1243014 RepID=A0A240ELZ5_9VIBR|nr:hypothetical protein VTH8203_03365 [Vibrio thalassae]